MIIWLILGILAVIMATIGCIMIMSQWGNLYSSPSIFVRCVTFFVTIALVFFAIFFFKRYYDGVVDYAMWNMECDNYVRTEHYENGNITKITYRIGDVDFD